MRYDSITSGKRKPVNLSIDTGIVAAARDMGINLSQVSKGALHRATRKENERRWLEDNREAIESSNQWVERHGLPFARHRRF